MTIVLETPAAAQVMNMARETLAVARVVIMDPAAAVATALAISLEVALLVVRTHTLVVGPDTATMTLKKVCTHLISFIWRFWLLVVLTLDCLAESTKDKLLGKVEGVLGRNKKDNDESSGGYGGNKDNY